MRYSNTLLPTFDMSHCYLLEIYDFKFISVMVSRYGNIKRNTNSHCSKFIARYHAELLSLEFEHILLWLVAHRQFQTI